MFFSVWRLTLCDWSLFRLGVPGRSRLVAYRLHCKCLKFVIFIERFPVLIDGPTLHGRSAMNGIPLAATAVFVHMVVAAWRLIHGPVVESRSGAVLVAHLQNTVGGPSPALELSTDTTGWSKPGINWPKSAWLYRSAAPLPPSGTGSNCGTDAAGVIAYQLKPSAPWIVSWGASGSWK